MPKFRMEVTERVVFDVEVEGDTMLDVLEPAKREFMDRGPVLSKGGDFMSGRCVVREAHYHFEIEEVPDEDQPIRDAG